MELLQTRPASRSSTVSPSATLIVLLLNVASAAEAPPLGTPVLHPVALTVEAAPPEEREPPFPVLGLQLGAGVPEGLSARVVLRPLRKVRLSAGVVDNFVSNGW